MYGAPKATIRRHAMKKNWYVNGVKALGRQATCSGDMEEILADHIIMLEHRFFGLSIKNFRKLAFDLVEKYKFPHTFKKEKMFLCIYTKKFSTVSSATRSHLTSNSKKLQQG
jgi:hypothetical protein